MQLEAFILPLPGRSVAVIFWDRVRRGAETALSVYAPGEPSPGELSEVSAALTRSIGEALAEQARHGPPPSLLALWWLGGLTATLAVVLHAIGLGWSYVWLAVIAVGSTLPWGMTAEAAAVGRRVTAARRVLRQLGQLEPAVGADQRARARIGAVWQFARAQRGSEAEQLRALERFCDEQAWPAAAAVYRERLAEPDAARRLLGERLKASRPRLFAEWEMRAWRST